MKRSPLALLIMTGLLTSASAADTKPSERFIQVMGEGEVKVEPDEVTLGFQIETFGRDLKEVQAENAQRTASVMETLKKFNVPPKDIQTSHAQISPRYDFNNGKRKFREYYSIKSFTLKLRDLSNYGAVLNALMDSGVENVGGVVFGSSKEKQLQLEARRKAAQDAKIKAEALASELGVKVGKPLSISENTFGGPPMPMFRAKAANMAMMAEAAPMPEDSLAGGEMEIKTQVTIQFELQ